MREYAKVSPKFWTGETGQELAKRGEKALLVALYLMTSPHSNMLGLYRQPVNYMAEETGLTTEGASEGLRHCMEAGFCDFDPASKFVWVFEMASYQIGSELSPKDLRVKGIQREYAALPNVAFLGPFFDKYAHVFHMTERRQYVPKSSAHQLQLVSPFIAPTKQGAGAGAGAGTGTGKPSASSPDKLPTCQTAEVIALYHEILPEMPKVRLHTKDRVRAIQKAWSWVLTSTRAEDNTRRAETAEQALEWFRDYFTRARSNDFLMGRGQRAGGAHENWRCDLDFLLTDKGMKHVIEKTLEPA